MFEAAPTLDGQARVAFVTLAARYLPSGRGDRDGQTWSKSALIQEGGPLALVCQFAEESGASKRSFRIDR